MAYDVVAVSSLSAGNQTLYNLYKGYVKQLQPGDVALAEHAALVALLVDAAVFGLDDYLTHVNAVLSEQIANNQVIADGPLQTVVAPA